MTDREKILEKLRKLKAHAESAAKIGSEQEAQAFAAMVQTMIARHNIGQAELTDVERAEQNEVNPIETVMAIWGNKRRRVAWLERLAQCVAHAHFCDLLINPHTPHVWFVGRKTQAEMARDVFLKLADTADRLSKSAQMQYYRENRGQRGEGKVDKGYGSARGFRPAYLEGFADRLGHRYFERMKELEDEAARQAGAIVLFKSERQQVREYIEDMLKGNRRTVLCIDSLAPYHPAGKVVRPAIQLAWNRGHRWAILVGGKHVHSLYPTELDARAALNDLEEVPEAKTADWHPDGRKAGKAAADKLDLGPGPRRRPLLPE